MRHTSVRLLGLLIALMLVLTGCNLIGVDPIMQLDEDMAALQKKYSGVVASYDGGEITQMDVMASLNSQYSYMSQLYAMYGLNFSSDMLPDLEQTVVENAVRGVAIAKQMEARGLKLDDEKLAEVQQEADEHYQEAYDSFYGNIQEKNEEVRAKQTLYDLAANGYSKEALYTMELNSANEEFIEQYLRDEIKDEDVTDEKLQAAYDEKLSEDESAYAGSPSSFESAMSSNSTVVTWMPEGYRTVKHILVVPADDVLNAYKDARTARNDAQSALDDLREELETLNSKVEEEPETEAAEETAEGEEEAAESEAEEPARTAEQVQADIDAAEANLETLNADLAKAEEACLASVQDKLDEIYAKIEAGDDFASLIETYGEDPGMQNEPTKTRGYYVCSASTKWDESFTAGAMALEKVGDVSEKPVVSASGVHIIRYESDVTPGAVPLEDIKDALFNETLENMKSEHYTSEIDAWVEALNPQYSIDAFNLE